MYETLSEPELRRILKEQGAKDDTATAVLAGHDLRLDGHDTLLAGYGSRIIGLEGRVTESETKINALDGRLTTAEAGLLAAEGRLDDHDTTLDEITRGTVTNEAEFTAALGRAEVITIRGTVTLTGQFTNTAPVRIVGEPGAKLVFTANTYCIDLKASLTIDHLDVEGISRDQGYFINIGGVSRAGSNAWLRLLNSSFRLMGNVVTMSGSGSAPLGPRTVVRSCRVSEIGSTSFTQFGQEAAFYLSWHLGLTIFDDVHFEDIHGNCLYFGQSGITGTHTLGEAIIVQNCHLKDFNRNGIETFSAARAFILHNYLTGGLGNYTNTSSPGGIGISCAGGQSVVAHNILENVWAYGIEIYRNGNVVEGNIIDGLVADVGNSIGLSIDNCSDTMVTKNVFKNIKHGADAKYAIKARVSNDVTIDNNKFSDVSYACWVAETCESIDFTNNQLRLERDSGALAVRAFRALSGNKHMVIHNRVRLGPVIAALFTPTDKQETFDFTAGVGGYYDYTTGLVTAGGTPLSFGNISPNIVV